MKSMKSLVRNLAGVTAVVFSVGIAAAAPARDSSPPVGLDGRWAATVQQGGVVIPFRLDIATTGNRVTGTLYNGDDKETTTSASIGDGKVELNFEHYLTSIKAAVKGGELDGQIEVTRRAGTSQPAEGVRPAPASSPFHAKRYVASTVASLSNAPSIDGVWEIPHESPKGEKAWRLIVKQNGPEISATVLRVDGIRALSPAAGRTASLSPAILTALVRASSRLRRKKTAACK
jgi:hypothetical protein